jgi:hypothetical protein
MVSLYMRELVNALCDVVLVCSVAGKSVAVRLFCAGRGVWPLDPERQTPTLTRLWLIM